MTALSDHKAPRPRFARSINVERDSGTSAVDGYLPVGRAVDAITRLATALDRDDVEVAISITGPYGSGKSSLAIVLDALLGPIGDPARASAEELLSHTAPDALARLTSARSKLGAADHGFIRAVVTAQREAITSTIVRALLHGAERFASTSGRSSALTRVIRTLRELNVQSVQEGSARPDTRVIRDLISDLGQVAPVFLLIDEFGKNLEAFADSHSDADLFLLQELAEWTRGTDGLPLALVTLQHMAFDEYSDGATGAQRREWAKIQGRFEDIPFVDSPAQTRALIAASFMEPSADLALAQAEWSKEEAKALSRLGLTGLAADRELLAACWPLHPIALAAIPELCERYGQNERTLFSFLAGHEPLSLASFLADTEWRSGSALPVVRLDRLYDYFLEAATNLVAVSSNASRWLEIDTRVRDAVGLSAGSRRVLKTVGLLNLVSAGGTLRASRALVCHAAADGLPGTKTAKQIEGLLDKLEESGLITFRDFADEYRVWHGSDFDLRTAIEVSRRRLRDQPAADILNRVLPMSPLVAARHSHRSGTLRAFERAWVATQVETIEPLGPTDRADGLALYVLGSPAPTHALTRRRGEKPTVFVLAQDSAALIDAAHEVAAIDEVLGATAELGDDWVARRELLERRVEALAALDRSFHATYGEAASEWFTMKPGKRRRWTSRSAASASSVLSDSCDSWYSKAPVIRNDLANRHELSSQAAKARRMLLEAMIAHADLESLGIEGFGPDNTLYLSVVADHGLHRQSTDGAWEITPPYSDGTLHESWIFLQQLLRDATSRRTRISDLYDELAAPPFGIRAGIAPVLLVAALAVASEEVALYEHGTFKPVLTADVLERLLRNPSNFEVKHYASRSGVRAQLLTQLADALDIPASRGLRNGRVGSVLAVVSHLVSLTNSLPEHIKKTRHLHPDTVAVRRALLQATEPDDLLFHEIPEAFDKPPVSAGGVYVVPELDEICSRLVAVCDDLRSAYPRLLDEVEAALREHVGPSCTPLREGLAARARELEGQIIDPRVAKLTVALTADIPDLEPWLTYVAMNVTAVPPEGWTDEDRRSFFVTIAEIGGTFRRIYALNADLDARGGDFDAYRSVFTRTDGEEIVQLVAIDESIRRAGRPLLEEFVARLSTELGVTPSQARSYINGLSGEADFEATRPSAADRPTDAYGEVRRSAEES